ncbi:hypothetical protein K1719_012207 [Acacia pycnantha]|nr:hypothetical protein K1719_012207 [Acacia pycnantha]
MAKSSVVAVDSDPAAVTTKVLELKKELNRLVNSIADDDDCIIQTIDQARDEVLSSLKDLKLRKKSSSSSSSQSSDLKLNRNSSFPEEFKCPLSKELMRDPVIVASGKVSVIIRIFMVSAKML